MLAPPWGTGNRVCRIRRHTARGGMTESELGPVQWQSPCTPRMIDPKGSGMKEHLEGRAGGCVLGAPVAQMVWRHQGEGPAAPCTWGPRDRSRSCPCRCTIDWKKGKNVTVKTIKKKQKHKGRGTVRTITKQVPNDSFFNFFSPLKGEWAGL